MPLMNVSNISAGSGALQNAASGLARASQGVEQDAESIATGSLGGSDTTAPLLDLSQQSVLAGASADAFSIANQTLGSLLDVLA